MKSGINKESKIVIGVIAFFLVISVGYAIFSQTLDIKGTASAEGSFDIIFTKVNDVNQVGSTSANAQIINAGKELKIEVPDLQYPTAYVNFNVTIKNNGTMAAKVTGIETNGLETDDIKVTYSGVTNDDILNINEEKDMDIKVKWDENSQSTSVSSDFTITITYEQVTDTEVTEPPQEEKELFTWDSPTVVSGLSEKGIEEVKQNGGHLVIPEGVTEIASSQTSGKFEDSIFDKGFSPFKILGKTMEEIEASGSLDEIMSPDVNIIKSINFPSTLKKIGNGAFTYCTYLTSINLPSSIEEIGDYAFAGTGISGELVIPNSVKIIGGYAFQSCFNITLIKLGQNVQTIGDYAFESCSSVVGELVIPNNVTSIGNSAFEQLNITSLTLGNSVKTIGDSAFHMTEISGELSIPDSVTSIGDNAFATTKITSLNLGNSLKSIGNSAFIATNLSGGLYIPDNVLSIGNSAFSMTELSNISISSSTSYESSSFPSSASINVRN